MSADPALHPGEAHPAAAPDHAPTGGEGNTMTANGIIRQDLDAILLVDDEPTLPVATRMTYDAADPFALSLTFRTGEGVVTWTFARDLLFEGMRRPTGEGDVRVSPDNDAIRLLLTAPTGQAEFALDAFDVAVFLEESTNVVARGQELRDVDLDLALARVLEDA